MAHFFTFTPKKKAATDIDFIHLIESTGMKILVATEKPFAKEAVDGIRRIVEDAGYELALLEKYTDKAQLLAAVADAPLPLLLALDQVQDPGNVGTLCRTLYALGGAGLLLPRHNSAYLGPGARRAAAGALEHLPVAQVTNLALALDSADEAGLTIYGAGGAEGPNSLDAFTDRMRLPAVLVLGNEDKGLRPGVAKRCAHMLRIPLARSFDSLNVAQAGAVLLGLAAAHSRGPVV